jgi:hypothetical protein
LIEPKNFDKLTVKGLESFGDFLFMTYENRPYFDLFDKAGELKDRIDLKNLEDKRIDLNSIDFCTLPRLEWSDR